ncbi:ABC-2 type transport system permease protein [Methanolinea mesophila]|uniref:ABC transporter permease n=1 Tax=Methanolinea mesophila TaxID=547055 RepID=UPI001FD785F0|nr:ABC transporter permease [Methanolinea mesophila]MBP1928913.1 ABC-2 type transport system permease protein [Methanolinea mesophila]
MMEVPVLLQGIFVITGKNMRLYYTKPPVLMFGVLFPLFMFFAFFVGRKLDLVTFFPAFLGMMVFFTASSVGPLITPWEKREKTYERLLSYPVTQDSIILGDVVAGVIFGLGIGLLVWIASTFFVPVPVTNPWLFALAFILGTFSCAALGALLASPASDSPPNVMIFSNLVRFPLIFISGIFIPLSQLEGAAQVLAYCSPLAYLVDLFNGAMAGSSVLSPFIDCAVLAGVTAVFFFTTKAIQKRNLVKGL